MMPRKSIKSSRRCLRRPKRRPSAFPRSCRHGRRKLLLSDSRPPCFAPQKPQMPPLLKVRKEKLQKRPSLLRRVRHRSKSKSKSNRPVMMLRQRSNPSRKCPQNLKRDSGNRVRDPIIRSLCSSCNQKETLSMHSCQIENSRL